MKAKSKASEVGNTSEKLSARIFTAIGRGKNVSKMQE